MRCFSGAWWAGLARAVMFGVVIEAHSPLDSSGCTIAIEDAVHLVIRKRRPNACLIEGVYEAGSEFCVNFPT